ncbi:CARDB domain-containing protein [Haloarcula salina]|uniref:CARDB domain-containing protein n=1 Tax=Haloarcula salina TaxID=1429914 RepID=UPI003C6FA136
MIRTHTLAVFVALLVAGGLAAQAGAVPGATAQQEAPTAPTTGVSVDSLTAPNSTAPNSTVTVAATVTNNGDEAVTEPVEFRLGGEVVERTVVSLDANESASVTFEANTTGLDTGEYRHGVFTSDDGQIAAITVSESFTLDSLDAPSNVTAGDNVTVNATVTNPNDFQTTQSVEFRLDGARLATQSVNLSANETTDVSFNLSTSDVDPGTYVHSVFTRDDGEFAELTVEEAPEEPTETPTEEPTENETEAPVDNETEEPTENETEAPIDNETEEPTENETEAPVDNETEEPTENETEAPIDNETEEPTEDETAEPIGNETEEPTEDETSEPIEETEEPTESGTEEGTEQATTEG